MGYASLAITAVMELGCALLANPGLLSGIYGFIDSGGNMEAAFMAGIMGHISAGVSGYIGELFAGQAIFGSSFLTEACRAGAHGIAQGGLSELQGGDLEAGFLSGSFSSAAGSLMKLDALGDLTGFKSSTVIAAVVGGTASELGGGKFMNGAITGAFINIFNHWGEHGDPDPLKRDANGEPIFHEKGMTKMQYGGKGGPKAEARWGYLETKDGKGILAFQNLSMDPRFDMDCHGFTLAGRSNYWINNIDMQAYLNATTILKMTTTPNVGDIVVWRENGQVKHSARLAVFDRVTMTAGINRSPYDKQSFVWTTPLAKGWDEPSATIEFWTGK